MAKHFRIGPRKAAQPPGTVEFVGEKKVEKVSISVIDYDADRLEEKQVETIAECLPYLDNPSVTWINIDGLHETDMLKELGERLGLHPLVLEDIVNAHQRPKLDDHEDYIYFVLKMLSIDTDRDSLDVEQLSLILGPQYVLTFQERPGDVFEPVRERLRQAKGRIRRAGADYLTWALMDAVVDNYFFDLEYYAERIEGLEQQLIDNPTPERLQEVFLLKREMIVLRRAIWPLREVISSLERTETKLIQESTEIFLRDLYDHTIRVAEAVESFRDLVGGLHDLYLSSISNRMNEVMKVLTIIATIFVPLTFVAGIYGMNFEFMPELGWRWSYAIFWVVILAIFATMIAYFRKRRWL